MHSPARPAEAALVRHGLVRVAPGAWRVLLAAEPALAAGAVDSADIVDAADAAARSVLRDWAVRGWPLMVRRPGPCDAARPGVPLGLPLPPSLGKRRIGVSLAAEAIVSIERPPALDSLREVAPPAWRATLDALDAITRRHRIVCRAFGSLAWQGLTGLPYLSANSDLDLLFELPPGFDAAGDGMAMLAAMLDDVAACEADAPMRIDGEVIRVDGAGANWRELQAGQDAVMVKTATDVRLLAPRDFLAGAA
ncbi:malonate decarboxylase holo-[acyl-carrier-protein] synthase [Burkholderia gladioli]|uniref:malonate decarboxylase holo-[acyl-carrier-protein] synthase n=1 Tax=Burkholderia gladioli TaxID=28095 RepID=UPI001641F526|nr:malonate decarboxylase holo-[acyl-carrier-protein] synthase [Burkholderia gladioli]MDN7803767.1 malonate decarboxylase holo-[acyl-carrier-protein] synthase [Burkholderia gladioli]